MSASPVTRPPLKWAGGKRWQVPYLRPLWQPHARRRLVEPFCGGLAVALGLRPERALLNDTNPHVIDFYGWLQRGLRVTVRMENLVNQATERVERLYRKLGFAVTFLDAPRRISCNGDRGPAREILGTRNV